MAKNTENQSSQATSEIPMEILTIELPSQRELPAGAPLIRKIAIELTATDLADQETMNCILWGLRRKGAHIRKNGVMKPVSDLQDVFRFLLQKLTAARSWDVADVKAGKAAK